MDKEILQDGYKRLAFAIFVNAVRDANLKNSKPLDKIFAACWVREYGYDWLVNSGYEMDRETYDKWVQDGMKSRYNRVTRRNYE
jgi:hypothetical protein